MSALAMLLTTSCAALLLPPPGRPVAAPDRPASISAFPVRMGLFDWLPGNQKEPVPPGYVQARHILFLAEPTAEKKANQLQSRILAGEISFSEAARAFSCCTFASLGAAGSLPLIGELPYQGKDTREFDEVLFSAELNVPVKAYSQWAALRIDGSKAPTGSWDRAALLSGFQNSAEIAARELRCAELPSDLVGTYYRNGHARFVGYDGKKVRHPFDADGLVTGVTLDGRSGTAVVRQRYVATDGAIAERAEQRSLYPGQFGNPRALWDGGVDFKNLANTNCLWHGGKLLALWEGSRPHILDPLSLATRGEWDVDGLVGSGPTDNFAAHPRLGTDGGVANFAYAGNPAAGTTTVRFWDFQPGSYDLRSPAQKHEVPGFGLYHDFLVTENYFVLVAAPATWGPVGQPLRALQMTLEFVTGKRPVGSMICFDESQPTTVYLFPRDERSGLRPMAIELDTFFSFHHANAWEEGNTLVFDTVSTPKLIVDTSSLEGTGRTHKGDSNRFIIEDIDYEQDAPRTDLVRYTLDLKKGSYSRRALSTRHVEFPSVAPSVRGRRHRFVYTTAGSKADGVSPAASVLKTDTQDASNSQIWLARPFEYCGEVIFTPRAGSTAEDDGYLLTLCYDGNAGTSALLVLDARRVADGPIARVPLSLAEEEGGEPLPVDAAIAGPGHGLHATFVPGLTPTLHEVQEAEEHRGRLGSRFLSDALNE